jgi:hypothetical protein
MDNNPTPSKYPCVLAIGLVGVFVLLGFILVFRLTSQPNTPTAEQRPDALANSSDACVACHRNASPGIVEQFGQTMGQLLT